MFHAIALTIDASEIATSTIEIYKALRGLAGAMSLVGLVIAGIIMMLGGGKNDDRAWKYIKNILLALGVMWTLILFIRMGSSVGQGHKWTWKPTTDGAEAFVPILRSQIQRIIR